MPNDYDVTQPYLGLIEKYRPKVDDHELDEQRKIARGNALAEAFRVLIDAVGGAKGANIPVREGPANAVTNAVNNYYKIREQNKAEQQTWDKMALSADIGALTIQQREEFEKLQRERQEQFTREQEKGRQTFQAAESEKERQQSIVEQKQQESQFGRTLGQREKEAESTADIKRQQIVADIQYHQLMYPDGRSKGMYISDPDFNQKIKINDSDKAQVLAFIQSDPAVREDYLSLSLRYADLGTAIENDFLITLLYPKLSPDIRAKIREFIGTDKTTQQNIPSSPFLQFLQPSQLNPPYQKGAAPLIPQTPTIKTNKKSTIVQAEQPAKETQPAGQTITPDEIEYIKKIIARNDYKPEVRMTAVYQYLIDQGYNKDDAKEFVDYLNAGINK